MDLRKQVEQARQAQSALLSVSGDKRTELLKTLAEVLQRRQPDILAANQRDLDDAHNTGLSGVLLHRLKLSPEKLADVIAGVEHMAEMGDPVGRELRVTELDENLMLRQVTSPLGVLLIIFESRPDAVIQIGALTLRSANAVVMKGGREAQHSNRILQDCLREALSEQGLPTEVVVSVEARAEVRSLLTMDELIDLVIPRGSNSLVRSIQQNTRIPVLGHADGICHIYLSASADPTKASRILYDAKVGYPAACNAVETILVHEAFLPQLPAVLSPMVEAGVEFRSDERIVQILSQAGIESVPAQPSDYGCEFGDLVVSLKVVPDVQAAMYHIRVHGSGHTESIVGEDEQETQSFLNGVDSAAVFHNVSTRFADGHRFGLGAEVGISTARIHARGPVGVDGLLTTRWILRGDGQVASDYGPGKQAYTHKVLL